MMIDGFHYLEQHGHEHSIQSFGIAESTMEQVFLRVLNKSEGGNSKDLELAAPKGGYHANQRSKGPKQQQTTNEGGLGEEELTIGTSLLMGQLKAMITTRANMTRRNYKDYLFQILSPAAIMLLMILSSKAGQAVQKAFGTEISNDRFMNLAENDTIVYYERDTYRNMTSKRTSLFRKSLLRYGLDSSCAEDRPLKTSHRPKSCIANWPAALRNSTTQKTLCHCADCSRRANTTDFYSRLPTGERLLWFRRGPTDDCWNMTCNFLHLKDIDYIGGLEMMGEISKIYKQDPKAKVKYDQHVNTDTRRVWGGQFFRHSDEENSKRIQTILHTWLTMLNVYNNVELRAKLLESGQVEEEAIQGYGITLSTEEVEMDSSVVTHEKLLAALFTGTMSTLGLFCYTYNIMLILVQDKAVGIKHLQFLMGLKRPIYWLSHSIWDLANLILATTLLTMVIVLDMTEQRVEPAIYFLTMFIYGVNMTLFAYVISFHVEKAQSALMVSMVMVMSAFVVASATEPLGRYLEAFWYNPVTHLLSLFPPYFVISILFEMRFQWNKMPWYEMLRLDVLGTRLLISLVWFTVMLLLVCLFEAGLMQFLHIFTYSRVNKKQESEKQKQAAPEESIEVNKPKMDEAVNELTKQKNTAELEESANDLPNSVSEEKSVAPEREVEEGQATDVINQLDPVQKEENKITYDPNADTNIYQDKDVALEEQRLIDGNNDYILRVRQVVKAYDGQHAVSFVSFGVKRGECFGLLGINGAGKTTLFKMLTGTEAPSAGSIRLMGKAIFNNYSNMSRHISYCPQGHVLYDVLTVREHLELYAKIRGIPANKAKEVISRLINELQLTAHESKLAENLSGGNKRKLNFGLAILTRPTILFLDEVSSGMDPKARRFAWGRLQKALNDGSAAVTTSHNLEEAEALSNRLVIMVNGKFRCMGGVQYLKDKFGNSYNLKFKVYFGTDVHSIQWKVLNWYENIRVVEERLCYLEVQIPCNDLKLSELFTLIHELKRDRLVEEFSVSQTTLEHVFVNLVRDQSGY